MLNTNINNKRIIVMSTPALQQWKSVKVYGCEFNQELKTMADTIDKLKLWNWFKTESPPEDKGYSWWGHPNIMLISNKLPNNPHSGATFSFALRQMQAIARQGFDKWNGTPE